MTSPESFEDFKNSFSYGSRTDLNFKFLAKLSDKEAIERIDEFVKEAPSLSSIPMDTPNDQLRVRHGGYDIRSATADPNVALPLELLRELHGDGIIGELALQAYSFVGACAQRRLLKRNGPQWVDMFRAEKIDAALLVPV